MRPDQLATVKDRLKAKAAVVWRVLNTPDGKELLDLLSYEFDGELFSPEPHRVMFNVGAREVVVYLRQLQKLGERNDVDS